MTKTKKRVLVVEDDKALMLGLEENLKYEGYQVLTASDGEKGLKLATERKPDLILLDVMLPGISGYEVCRTVRDRGLTMPIIMLTARKDEFDKIYGFDMGADDYVTKPFGIKELLARVNAALRREERRKTTAAVFTFDEFVLDQTSRTLRKESNEIRLTHTEFDLLAYFLAHTGQALSRERLLNEVWHLDYYGTQRSLDTFVASLRKKIEKDPKNPKHILTVHGVGYKFVGNE